MTEKTRASADVQESSAGDDTRTPEEIEAEIAETREELGDTVGALADRADVRKQAKRKVEESKERAQEKASAAAESAKRAFESAPETASHAADRTVAGARENPTAAIAAVLGVVLLLFMIRRRR